MKPSKMRKLAEKATLAALTGLLANPEVIKGIWDDQGPDYPQIVDEAILYAECLVNKMIVDQIESETHDKER